MDVTATLIPEPIAAAFELDGGPVEPIASGRVNEHWLVWRGGERCVLRRYAAGQTAPSIAWEHRLLRHFAGRGWPVAAPLASAAGDSLAAAEGALFALFPFLAGAPVEFGTPAARTLKGRLLARLHADGARFEEGQRPGLGRAWELDALAARADGLTFNALLATFAREYPELGRGVRAARYRNLRELARLGYGDLPDAVVHCDFHNDNLFFEGGHLSALLDFDWAHRDAAAYDIAVSLSLDCLTPPVFDAVSPEAAGAFIAGYAGLRRLSEEEIALVPALIRAAWLSLVTFRLVQWHEGWLPAGRAVASVARTVERRFPALDGGAPALIEAVRRANASVR